VGNEAFERARREHKPVFLSIGYYTCHWCHVMERESYSNAEIAAVLSQYFVVIKVDREERPISPACTSHMSKRPRTAAASL